MNILGNGLGPWSLPVQILGWGVLALLPPAILLLYFLKLRRQPLQVPSTYLWSRTIEDLHVNSIWQRLRRSILLLLQLLFAGLLLLSLMKPGCSGTQLQGERYIFMIDTSASMAADVDGKSRLELAKEETAKLIEAMQPGSTGMLISFSDRATIEQSFVNNKNALLRKLGLIEQTQRRTDLDEALRAASGLANPGRSSQDDRDLQVADALPATLFILTDGGVKKVPDFSTGNLTTKYMPIGESDEISNAGIIDFSVESNPENLQQRQAFARILNGGETDVTIDLSLYLNDRLRDSMSAVEIKAGEELRQPFELNVSDGLDTSGVLRLEIETEDDLAEDNVAKVVFNPPRKSKVLFVTAQNAALETALSTTEARRSAEVDQQLPSYLTTDEYRKNATSGYYDLVIYDTCEPETMPAANTFFIAGNPPSENWTIGAKQSPVLIVDTANTHPLLSMVELGNVLIADSAKVEGPKGSVALIDSNFGTIFAIGPRGGYEDAIMGFAIVESNDGEMMNNTDWPRYLSFPLFIQNVVQYLGSRSTLNTQSNVAPGQSVELRGSVPVEEITIRSPSGRDLSVKPSGENTFLYSDTDLTGIYEITEGSSGNVDQRFAVNILDKRESDLKLAENLEIGFETVEATSSTTDARYEFWKWLLIIGFVLLCAEWYIYNRRVFL